MRLKSQVPSGSRNWNAHFTVLRITTLPEIDNNIPWFGILPGIFDLDLPLATGYMEWGEHPEVRPQSQMPSKAQRNSRPFDWGLLIMATLRSPAKSLTFGGLYGYT